MLHDTLRRQFWPVETTVAMKPFGSLENLRCTAAFVRGGTGVSIGVFDEKKKKKKKKKKRKKRELILLLICYFVCQDKSLSNYNVSFLLLFHVAEQTDWEGESNDHKWLTSRGKI